MFIVLHFQSSCIFLPNYKSAQKLLFICVYLTHEIVRLAIARQSRQKEKKGSF